jgi:hypothetical protein
MSMDDVIQSLDGERGFFHVPLQHQFITAFSLVERKAVVSVALLLRTALESNMTEPEIFHVGDQGFFT